MPLDRADVAVGSWNSDVRDRRGIPNPKVMETNAVMETDAVVETRMLTVAAGVRSAMRLYAKHNNDDMNLRSEDFAVVKNFLSSPGAYVRTGASAAKTEGADAVSPVGKVGALFATCMGSTVRVVPFHNDN